MVAKRYWFRLLAYESKFNFSEGDSHLIHLFAGMAENKGYTGDEGNLDEEMKMTKEREGDPPGGGGGGGCQSEKKEGDPELKDSDADFEDLEEEGGGGNALGDGLERLWTGLGGILSRHSRWVGMVSLCT